MNTSQRGYAPGQIVQTYTSEEWALRQDLAAAYRLAHHFGWDELIYNHITVEIPGSGGHFLINPMGLRYDEVSASNLIKIDLQGNILSPTAFRINRAGFIIHSAIHAARSDAFCVVHTHSRSGLAVASLKTGLQTFTQSGMQFHNRVAYHDYEGFNVHFDEQERLVSSLGNHQALILRNHGLLTIGNTIGKAFQRMFFLEQACQTMLDILSTGCAFNFVPESVLENTASRWADGSSDASANDDLEWAALRRLADKLYPDYRL
ncbi:ribulose-5-phosphate 4-epimerase-like epimerase or aldolase [Pseudomonas sp. GM33]|uniref:class II aldolase/adducin family protein n=1 Tax=Pseudomonas sp. GM33 TaxID=1144329 RepID=UPI00026FF1F2|nr:class II aldolase/adducin family protein [Pseudomonas sp. GM33]EJM34496.1 ribulose-5-phosphate 4-epimerase-like epimerase or aldolase [Pseudomonas sp. GM33]